MKAAVVVPVYKSSLSDLEQLSLSRCVAELKNFPLVFVGPRSLDYAAYNYVAPSASTCFFDSRYFLSVAGYSELLLSTSFYEQFRDFAYMLIHQLDAFVFRDSLWDWCLRGFDFVGAPWVTDDGHRLGVGNGGLSLRNVNSCIAVLQSNHRESPEDYWAMVRLTTPNTLMRKLKYYRKVRRAIGIRDNVSSFLRRFISEGRPEDLFWGIHARRFYSGFNVAPVETAFEFAIEGGLLRAQDLYRINPPLGCHQNRFLRMILRYLNGAENPETDYECLVWDLARKAGLRPGEL